MNKLLFIIAVIALLPACSNGTEDPASTHKQISEQPSTIPAGQKPVDAKQSTTPKPAVKVDKSRAFSGSRMSLEEALAEADLVALAKSLTLPLELEGEIGVIECFNQKFEVLDVLKGKLDEKTIVIHYIYVTFWHERRVEKGENVCCFIKKKMVKQGKTEGDPPKITYTDVLAYEAIKIVQANQEMIDKIGQLLSPDNAPPQGQDILKRVNALQKVAVLANKGQLGCGTGTFELQIGDKLKKIEAGLDPIHVFGKKINIEDLKTILASRVDSYSNPDSPMSGDFDSLCYVCLSILKHALEPGTVPLLKSLLQDPSGAVSGWGAIALIHMAEKDDNIKSQVNVIIFPSKAIKAARSRGAKIPDWIKTK